MTKQPYVSPKVLNEELSRLRNISEYKYFTDISEADDQENDQLTMDDFNAPAGGGQPPAGGGQPPAGGGQPPAGGEHPPQQPQGGAEGTPPEAPFGGATAGADAAADALGDPTTGTPPVGGGDAQEIDVTDIVNDTKAVSQKTDEMTQKVDQTTAKVDAIFSKIQSMEQSVQNMNQAVDKINAIYKEVELSKPPTPEEVKEVMAGRSYPFNVPVDKFGQEGTAKNQTELEKGKKLSLSNLLSDFNERELRNSFNPPDPFEDKVAKSMPSYRI
jgi:hypothetical protein